MPLDGPAKLPTGTEVLARQGKAAPWKPGALGPGGFGGGRLPVGTSKPIVIDTVAVWEEEGRLRVGPDAGLIREWVVTSDTPPADPFDGQLWWNSNTGELYVWYDDGTSQQWVIANKPLGFNRVWVVTGDSPPVDPFNGQLWWDSQGGELYVRYDDGTSTQWVVATSGAREWVVTSSFPPSRPFNGQVWWNSNNGEFYLWYDDGTSSQWVIANNRRWLVAADQPPFHPFDGQLWWDSAIGELYLRYNDGTSSQWVIASTASGGVGGTKVTTADQPPPEPFDGQLWWDSRGGQLYVWYDDGTSSQWVIANTFTEFGGSSSVVSTDDQPPSHPVDGQLWWDSAAGELYVRYDDGTSSQWVIASSRASAPPTTEWVVTSDTPPTMPFDGQLWWNSATGDLYVRYDDGTSRQWVIATQQGPAGVQGPQGLAATIAVGATTTGSPGTSAMVTNTGSSSAAIFNFRIPSGVAGPAGPPGSQGLQGIPGVSGPAGGPGPQGPAATIAVGTTVTGVPGTPALVTNSGSSSAAVFNFTIPQGAQGVPGVTGAPGPNWNVGSGLTLDAGSPPTIRVATPYLPTAGGSIIGSSPGSIVVGTPSLGNMGAGTINATGLYVNGVPVSAGGVTPPGGSNLQLQFNNAGSFGGLPGVTASPNTNSLSVVGSLVIGTPADGSRGAGTINTSGLIQINDSPNATNLQPSPFTSLHISSDTNGRFLATGYGGNPGMTMRFARGTGQSPAPVQVGDNLGMLSWTGFSSSSSWAASPVRRAGIGANVTAAGWSTGSEPTYLTFETTAASSTTSTERMRLALGLMIGTPADGDLGVGTLNTANMIQINNTSGTNLQPSPFTLMHIAGEANARLLTSGYGTGNSPGMTMRFARGTGGAPTVVQAGDSLGALTWTGYTASGWAASPVRRAGIGATVPTGGWAAGSEPTYLSFDTTAASSIATTERMRLYQGLLVGTASALSTPTLTDQGPGTINVSGGFYVNNSPLSAGGTPGAPTGSAQYNNAGAFGGSTGLTLSGTKITAASMGLTGDTPGDMYYGAAGGALTRIPPGSNGNLLQLVAGVPTWQPVATGGGTVNSGTGPQIAQYPAGTTQTVAGVTMSGDATLAQGGAITLRSDIALAGNPTTTTQGGADNSTRIATTAFVKGLGYVTGGPYIPTAGGSITGSSPGSLVIGAPPDGSLGAGTLNVSTFMQINNTTGGTSLQPSPFTLLHVAGEANARILTSGYGTGNAPGMTLRFARGTGGAPTAVQASDSLGVLTWTGFSGSAWATSPVRRAGIGATVSAAGWTTGTSEPTYLTFDTTAAGSIASIERMRLYQGLVIGSPIDGDLGVGTLNTSAMIQANATSATGANAAVLTTTMLHVSAETGARILGTGFGGPPGMTMRASLGTSGTPTPVTADTALGQLNFTGYATTQGWITTAPSRAAIVAYAGQTFGNAANQGTYIGFLTTANNSTAQGEVMRLAQGLRLAAGNTAIAALTDQGPGTINVSDGFFVNNVRLATGSGSGTVNAGLQYRLAYYPNADGSTLVDDLPTVGAVGTVLHGQGAAAPTWAAVNLASEVTGNLPVTNLAGGSGATNTTYWRGDGTWGTPAGSGSGVVNNGSINQVTYYAANGTGVSGSNAILMSGTSVTGANMSIGGTPATGDIYYRAAGGALTQLVVGTGTQVLGVAAGVPAWVANPQGTVTNVGLTVPGTIFTAGGAVNTSGNLSFTVAGTSGGVPYFSSATALGTSGALGTGLVILGGGAGNPPTALAAGTTAQFLKGNSTWSAVSLTTDVSGVLQAAQEPAHTGEVTNSAGSLALTIANNAVTYAKMQASSATARLLGTGASGTAFQEITLGTGLSFTTTTLNNTGVTNITFTGPGGIFGVTGSPVTTTGGFTLSTTGAAGALAYFGSANVVNALTIGSTDQVLRVAAGLPAWGAVNLAAAAAVTGILPTVNLGTGTRDTTTFLRGDGTWQVPPTGTGIAGSGTAGQAAYFTAGSSVGSSPGLTMNTTNVTGMIVSGTSPGTVSINRSGIALTATTGEVWPFRVMAADGADSGNAIMLEGYGAAPALLSRAAGGTSTAVTATALNQSMFSIVARGFDGVTAGTWSGGRARIQAVAHELWSSTTNSTRIELSTTPVGTTAMAAAQMTIGPTGVAVGAPTAQATPTLGDLNVKRIFVDGGVIPPSSLGTGTPSSSNFLRGDGTWQAAGGSTSPGTPNLSVQYNSGGAFTGAGVLVSPNANSLNIPGSVVVGTPFDGALGSGTYNQSGLFAINANTATPNAGIAGTLFQLTSVNGGNPAMCFDAYGGNPTFAFRKSGQNLGATGSYVGNGAQLGAITYYGWTNTGFTQQAAIWTIANAAWSANSYPTRMDFYGTSAGSGAMGLRMRLIDGLTLGSSPPPDPGVGSLAVQNSVQAGTPTAPSGGYVTGDINGVRVFQNGVQLQPGFCESVGWIAGASPNNAIVWVNNTGRTVTIQGMTGTPEVVNGSAATVNVVVVASTSSIQSGSAVGSAFDANATAYANQSLGGAGTTVANGSRIGLKQVGTPTWTGSVATITVYLQ